MMSVADRQKQNKWIRALHEPLAGIEADKTCITFNDVHKNGDHKLILVDFKEEPCRLILFQGLSPLTEAPLTDYPTGIETLYCDPNVNSVPCLAVASGSSVLVYRNMKPYYRFSVPQLYLYPPEIEVWERTFNGHEFPVKQLYDSLLSMVKEIHISFLTEQTHELFTLKTDEARQTFVDGMRNEEDPPILSNVRLTCIFVLIGCLYASIKTTMKRNQQRFDALDVMVLGAEIGSIYWVDCQAFTVLEHTQLKGSPVKMLNLGLYDIEFRTFVIMRTGEVVILKKTGRTTITQTVFYLRSHPMDMIYSINQLIFSTRDNRILFYSVRGKCLNELQMDGKIADISQFYYEPRQYQGIFVAVGNEIRLYSEMFLVDKIKMDEDIDWIRFGRMGFEEGVLLIGTVTGGLCAKIFRRTAILGEKSPVVGAPIAQSQRLNVPRRTKAFIDQSLRERDNFQRLHQIYQRDLFMLKYHTVKTFAALQSGETGLQPSRDVEPIDFNLDLLGFGPTFLLIVNLSANRQLPIAKRSIMFTCDANEYSTTHKLIRLPDLLPSGVPLKLSTHVQCLQPENQSPGEMRIILIRADWKQPVFSASIQMPISELEVE